MYSVDLLFLGNTQALAESLGVPCRLRSYHPLAVTPLERAPDAVAATASQPDQHSAL
jgi:hypothetical protein